MIDSIDKLTVLMPGGPFDLVNEDGNPVEYEGVVYRADEVAELVDNLKKEA